MIQSILSYVVLALFLGGSLYFLGLMFYILFKGSKTKVKPLSPDDSKHPRLPHAA
ncbi:MAG: hypothetical protein ACLFUB_15445 [Cyclobacteriaceae bacterium]